MPKEEKHEISRFCRAISSAHHSIADDFAHQSEHYIRTAEEFEADFVLFPEFLRPS